MRGRMQLDGEWVVYEEVRKNQVKAVAELQVIVKSEEDWKNISKDVTELIIEENACNEMKGDLVIAGFKYLRRLYVRKNSMKFLNSVKICDCEMLETIETEGSEKGWDVKNDCSCYSAFDCVKSVEISSFDLTSFLIRSSSFDSTNYWSFVFC